MSILSTCKFVQYAPKIFVSVIVMMTPIFAHDMSKVKLSQSQQQPPRWAYGMPCHSIMISVCITLLCSFLGWYFLALLKEHIAWSMNTKHSSSSIHVPCQEDKETSQVEGESLTLTHYVLVPVSSSSTHTKSYTST